MVEDEIHYDTNASPVSFLHKTVKVCDGAKARIDAAVISDIVAKIGHRGWVDGREPDGIDAKRACCSVIEIIESRDNPWQIANAIAIGVLETPGIDLVHNR